MSRSIASYKVLVGMEIHVQLATESKMFTGCANAARNFKAEPNSLVDEQVLGLPGTLPVMNRLAVEYSMRVGLALGCRIARHTKWDRKNYFYPDLPKGYQISQYDLPLCEEGVFDLAMKDGTKRVRIRRAHLEEDAGKLLHEAPGGFAIEGSIIDLNRAGTPLLEIVTEPDLTSGAEAAAFGQELQKIVQFLGVSEGQMQMGHMRFEPNINVHITDGAGQVHKTAITEVKNLNSFNAVQQATDFEVQRQLRQWEETGELGRKSTYGWNDARGETFHQRDKEEAHDYRYFPDPDLVVVEVDDAWLAEIKAQVSELPAARLKRYTESLGLKPADAAILSGDRATGDFFEAVVAAGAPAVRACGLMETLRELARDRGVNGPKELRVTPERVAEIAVMVQGNQLAASKETARQVIEMVVEKQCSAKEAAQTLGLLQSSDTGAIDAAIDAMIAANPPALADYKAGKKQARGALIGMVMKNGKGLNAKMVGERLDGKLFG